MESRYSDGVQLLIIRAPALRRPQNLSIMKRLFTIEIGNYRFLFDYVNFRYAFEVVQYFQEYYPEEYTKNPNLNADLEDLYLSPGGFVYFESEDIYFKITFS